MSGMEDPEVTTARSRLRVVLVVLAALLMLAIGMVVQAKKAHADPGGQPTFHAAQTLASLDYNGWAKGPEDTKKILTSPDFRVRGTYDEIDVIDTYAATKDSNECVPYTIQLFRVGKKKIKQVGQRHAYGCPAPNMPTAYFTGIKDGTYFVLNTCTTERVSDVCGTGGTIIYGRK